MSEKLNQNPNEGDQKTAWDEMAEFQNFVDTVRKNRAEKAAREEQEKSEQKQTEQEKSKNSLPDVIYLEDKQANRLALEDKQSKKRLPALPELPDKQADKQLPALPELPDKQTNKQLPALPELPDKQSQEQVIIDLNEDQYHIAPDGIEQKPTLALEDKQKAELEQSQELEIQRNKELLYQTVQEVMEQEQKLTEKELYDTIQSQMELEDQAKTEAMTPLTAIDIDWTHDAEEISHDLAEQALNAEVADAKGVKGIVKRIWKGTLFKKYYEQKYTKEFANGKRTTDEGETAFDILKKQMPETMERFVLGAVESDEYIHRNIGKNDGEKLEKVDEATNEKLKGIIADYARRRPAAGEKVSDLNREFTNEIGRILAEQSDGTVSNNNYLKVAEEAARRYQEISVNAKTKAEHDAAIAQVMLGFQAYNGEVRSNVRTEAHRDNIDKITNAIESSKIGRFIPAEIVAGAVGIAASFTQTGVRAVAGAGAGIIASSVISGLKERNRITEDRCRMMRDIANGMDYGNDEKTAKYEKRMGGTLYDMQKAGDLTAKINQALDPESGASSQDILRAIAEARVRIDFSDSEQKDLISYSSANNRGKERLDLDIAVIRAEKSLSDEDKKALEGMKAEIRKQIVDGYDDESGEHHAGVAEQDKDFKKFRAIKAMQKSGKTLGLGIGTFLASQEIIAALDPSKIGIFEKTGLLKTENNVDAQETLIASGFGRLRGSYNLQTAAPRSDIHTNVSDPNQVKYYEENGYTKIETVPASSHATETLQQVDPSASTARVDVKYDGWANNGTKLSDGNELRAHIENGKFFSTMRGASTMNGETIDYDPSSVKAYITVGNSKFEIAGALDGSGQMTWGDNGVFTTTTGETIKAIGDNGEKLYKYFEIAADNGVDADGIQHIIPLATDIGQNTFAGKLEQVVTTVTESPATYTFVKNFPGASETFIRDVSFNGIGFAPETARRGLGRAAYRETPTEEIQEAPETPDNLTNSRVVAPEAPETNPEPAPETSSETIPEPPEATQEAPRTAPETAPEAPEPAPAESEPGEGAPAPETPPEAPETPPEVPEQAPGQSSESPTVLRNVPENLRQFATDYENLVTARRATIGDNLAFYLLSDTAFAPDAQATIANEIRNLTPDGKTALREILAMKDNLPDEDRYQFDYGNALDAVLALTPDILQ